MITSIPTTLHGVPLLTPAQLAALDACNQAEATLHDALAEAARYGTSELPWHLNQRIINANRTLAEYQKEGRE